MTRPWPSRLSHDMEVLLPGGLQAEDGTLERLARFKELTGRLELALVELDRGMDTPSYVSSVLSLALDSIGSRGVDSACAAQLCVADRQYLMLRLAAVLSGEQLWLKNTCKGCGEPFDVSIRRGDLPVVESGPGFPYVKVNLQVGEVKIRIPNGADQAAIVGMPAKEAERYIIDTCLYSVNGRAPEGSIVQRLLDDDIKAIDEAMDKVSPSVCSRLLVVCPECGKEQSAGLDHYLLYGLDKNAFYDEVHTLAMHYHWSEDEILALPRSRRRRYLDLINRSGAIS